MDICMELFIQEAGAHSTAPFLHSPVSTVPNRQTVWEGDSTYDDRTPTRRDHSFYSRISTVLNRTACSLVLFSLVIHLVSRTSVKLQRPIVIQPCRVIAAGLFHIDPWRIQRRARGQKSLQLISPAPELVHSSWPVACPTVCTRRPCIMARVRWTRREAWRSKRCASQRNSLHRMRRTGAAAWTRAGVGMCRPGGV